MLSPDNPFADTPIMLDRAVLRPAELDVWVPGDPKPQGSKDYLGQSRKGRAILKESSEGLPAWRADVRAALIATGVRLAGPVSVGLEFVMPRPQRARPGDPADRLKDLDKLARGVLDAMESAGTIENDVRVVNFHQLHKRLAEPGEATGCHVTVRRWPA